MDVNAPAQIITAPAQIIIAPAQPPATGAAVYTALFRCFRRRVFQSANPPVCPSITISEKNSNSSPVKHWTECTVLPRYLINAVYGYDFELFLILPCKLKGLLPHVEAEATTTTTASVKTKIEEIIFQFWAAKEKKEMAVTGHTSVCPFVRQTRVEKKISGLN